MIKDLKRIERRLIRLPFKSRSQRRLFYAKLKRGEISKSKVDEWERETKGKKLPERLKKKKTRTTKRKKRKSKNR